MTGVCDGQDEHDVDDTAYDAIRPRVAQLRKEMQAHLADGNRGEIIRSGAYFIHM
jgi:tRNA modification GTPase